VGLVCSMSRLRSTVAESIAGGSGRLKKIGFGHGWRLAWLSLPHAAERRGRFSGRDFLAAGAAVHTAQFVPRSRCFCQL